MIMNLSRDILRVIYYAKVCNQNFMGGMDDNAVKIPSPINTIYVSTPYFQVVFERFFNDLHLPSHFKHLSLSSPPPQPPPLLPQEF